MSRGHVKAALISAIAESIGISDLSDDAARVLAPDVEYRVRDILQEATKFSRHAHRRRLECQDINHALQVRDMEQLYGFSSSDRRRYSQVAGAPDTFRLDDTLHRCEDVINKDLPPTPVDAGLQLHWFLVNGIKPRIPENEVPRELIKWHQDKAAAAAAAAVLPPAANEASAAVVTTVAAGAAAGSSVSAPKRQMASVSGAQAGMSVTTAPMGSTHAPGTCALDKDGKPVTLLPVVRHSLTEELHALLKLVTQVLLQPTEPVSPDHPVYASLAADSGINPILPYVVAAIKRGGDERASLNELPRLWRLLWAARALVQNTGNSLSAQLPQLLPALLSLLVNKRIGKPGDDHWSFRVVTARCLAALAERFPAPELQVRARVAGVCRRVLEKAAAEGTGASHLAACFGAAMGLQAMSMQLVCVLLFPLLPSLIRVLTPCMSRVCVTAKERQQQADSWHCMGALQTAICAACRDAVAQSVSAGSAALAAANLDVGHMKSRWDSESWNSKRKRQSSTIDKRLLEIEKESEKRLLEEGERKRQALGQEARLQAVEVAALASIDNPSGSAGHTADKSGVQRSTAVLSERERVAAAARAAAQTYDPAQPQRTASGAVPVEVDGEGDNPMQSPPGSPVMIIPPPPRSPPSKAPATSASVGGTGQGQPGGQSQAISQQHSLHHAAAPLTAAAPASAGVKGATSADTALQQPVNHSSGNGAVAPLHATPASSPALSTSVSASNGANVSKMGLNGSETVAPNGAAAVSEQPPHSVATTGTMHNVQSTGVNGAVGADRTNGKAQPESLKGQPDAGQSHAGGAAHYAASSAAGQRRDFGCSDLEGDGVQCREGATGAAGTSRSDKLSSARIDSSTSGPDEPNGITPEALQVRAVGLNAGCVECIAGDHCTLHGTEALKELQAKLAWASKQGKVVSVHVETAYEVFGEAVLQWMPLPWLGETQV